MPHGNYAYIITAWRYCYFIKFTAEMLYIYKIHQSNSITCIHSFINNLIYITYSQYTAYYHNYTVHNLQRLYTYSKGSIVICHPDPTISKIMSSLGSQNAKPH
jgi:hypothetical protein